MIRLTLTLAGAATLLAALALFAPARLLAQGETHAPHVHGAASLNVTVEASSADLDFSGPLASFISFEHAPSTPEQRAAMQALVDRFKDPSALFAFPAAWGCTVSKTELDGENIPEDILGHPHKAEGEGHGHGHGEEEDHDHGEEAGHDHAEGEGGHSDLDLEVEFACPKAGTGPASLDLAELFKAFPNLQDLDVQLVSPQGQKGAELSPASTKLTW
jgi:hypothetical protein